MASAVAADAHTRMTSPPETPEPALVAAAERIEAAAALDLVHTLSPAIRERYRADGERIGESGVVVGLRRLDVPMFNRAFALGLGGGEIAEETLDRVQERYSASAMSFLVQVTPGADTDELRARLEGRGLRRADNWVKVRRGADPPPDLHTDLRVEQVGPEWARPFGEVVCAAFGLPLEHGVLTHGLLGAPGWRHYLAFDGDTPVAAGALLVRGQSAWLGLGATLASHRGRGGQGAIMARRIREALALGCSDVFTETGEQTPERPNPSYRNMLRAGFRPLYLRRNYVYRSEHTAWRSSP